MLWNGGATPEHEIGMVLKMCTGAFIAICLQAFAVTLNFLEAK